MGKCLQAPTVPVRKRNLKSTGWIDIVVIIIHLFYVLVSAEMCS